MVGELESNAKHNFQLLAQKYVGQQILRPKNLGPTSLVKIKSVIAEIFLILTNVTRANVAWTNVTVTGGICSIYSQGPMFKVPSKSGQ